MIQKREKFVTTRAARFILGIALAAGLGATVVASPVHSVPAPPASKAVAPVAFQPLGDGPAVSVKKSFGRHDEDCVTVTQIRGADGRLYATRGMVCAE